MKVTQTNKNPIAQISEKERPPAPQSLELKEVKRLKNVALIRFAEYQGIPELLAKSYFRELRIYNHEKNKSFLALGMKNESGGYYFCTKFLESYVRKEDISFIRGTKEIQEKVHLFLHRKDFLSWLRIKGKVKHEDDAIVLHSLRFLKEAPPLIQNYTYKTVYTWFPNRKAGDKATNYLASFCGTQNELRHSCMRHQYKEHKDLNHFLVSKLGLRGNE
ncbi:hypothetical protein HHL16_03960 [Pseudoflavitalea sp. G-6-1-2]|uniref:hypothetical protein n=1 Tax=Pseudoflavitalea sp. G-6-1-2 TaxID=2728841 RepID=UPI00146BCC7A|nr:hypothetical protein [Pseudoflavitalea sp. G-6-1-2]NML20013.1 hypothetical protein [Pseudoflavitalea sp. G-6-1-2]